MIRGAEGVPRCPAGCAAPGDPPRPAGTAPARQFLPRDRQETQSVKRPKPAPLKREERPGAGTAPCLCCPPAPGAEAAVGCRSHPAKPPGLTRISSAFQLLEGVFQVPRHHQHPHLNKSRGSRLSPWFPRTTKSCSTCSVIATSSSPAK